MAIHRGIKVTLSCLTMTHTCAGRRYSRITVMRGDAVPQCGLWLDALWPSPCKQTREERGDLLLCFRLPQSMSAENVLTRLFQHWIWLVLCFLNWSHLLSNPSQFIVSSRFSLEYVECDNTCPHWTPSGCVGHCAMFDSLLQPPQHTQSHATNSSTSKPDSGSSPATALASRTKYS